MTISLIKPFTAIRPAAGRAGDIAAPPYDVLSSEEARAMAAGKPLSFLHVSKAEIDLRPDTDPYAPEVYAKAAENMARLLAAGHLIRDVKPCYYAYRLIMNGREQTGIAAAANVADYDSNRIRKHEFTRPAKEDDRVRQIEAVKAHTGPVLAAHRPNAEISEILGSAKAFPSAADATLDGVRHTVWTIDRDEDIARLTAAFDAMPAIYIADGHHRSAAASRVAAQRRIEDRHPTGDKSYDRFLIVSFPEDEMRILDYNRVVKDLAGMDVSAFLARLSEAFLIEPQTSQAKPDCAHSFGMYLGRRWYLLTLKDAAPSSIDPVARLDVSLLYDRLLDPLLKIGDQRRDPRIDFVGGIRGLGELEKRVDSGEMAVAFALHPTSMRDLLAVADAGKVMPPKSTWFEPKLADGLISLPIE